jgi:uncharacterized membrane protein
MLQWKKSVMQCNVEVQIDPVSQSEAFYGLQFHAVFCARTRNEREASRSDDVDVTSIRELT